jgi:hypothetical protein
MKKLLQQILILATLILCSCATLPEEWPENESNFKAINSSSIFVKEGFKFSPSLTSYLLPPGQYIPYKEDKRGTYYAAPAKMLISTAGGSFYVEGGIMRKSNPNGGYGMAVFYNNPAFGMMYQDLYSLWGLDLNELIESNPEYIFE